jgi:hypothetical protein
MRTEWTTRDELLEDFIVESFMFNMCVVTRKSDNQKGVLDFTHIPRVYSNFQPI